MENESILRKLRMHIDMRGRGVGWISKEAHISQKRIKGLLEGGSFDTECFVKVCNAIGIDVFDIVEDGELNYELFCLRVRRYVVKILIEKGITVESIADEFGEEESRVRKSLCGVPGYCVGGLRKHAYLRPWVIDAVYCNDEHTFDVMMGCYDDFRFEYCLLEGYEKYKEEKGIKSCNGCRK